MHDKLIFFGSNFLENLYKHRRQITKRDSLALSQPCLDIILPFKFKLSFSYSNHIKKLFLDIMWLFCEKFSLWGVGGWGVGGDRKCPPWALPAWQCSLLHRVKQFIDNQLGFGKNSWKITLGLTQIDLQCWPELSTNNEHKHTRKHEGSPITWSDKQL